MKTLYRSQTNKKIAGVCAGFAEYFELDAALIRIIWLSAILLFGSGILLYLICWLIMPPRPENNILVPSHIKPLQRSSKNKVIGGVCGGLGAYFQLDPVIVRVGFLVLAFGAGWGFLLYLILWIALPLDNGSNT